jgi:putative redox protein
MEANITWLENVSFSGVSDSGHVIAIDGPKEFGGRNTGTRPMELMLLGLGGCASFDVITILTKGRAQISKCVARITAQRAVEDPKVFTHIHFHFTLAGENLSKNRISRAVELSAEKYCSASIMMQRAGIDVTHSFDLEK